jgi:hypothetical protein
MPMAVSVGFAVACATGTMPPLKPFLFAYAERVYSAIQ